MQSILKSLQICILAMVLVACRPGSGPDVTRGVGMTTTQLDPPAILGTLEPGSVSPTPSRMDQPSPTRLPSATIDQITPPFNPTRLPEPHVVHVLDWELLSANSSRLCAGCEGDVVMVVAPRKLGIAVVRVYSNGNLGDAAAVESDLAFSMGVDCRVDTSGGFCGLIFGQVKGGVLTLRAQHVAGGAHQLTYLITFQNWADYTLP